MAFSQQCSLMALCRSGSMKSTEDIRLQDIRVNNSESLQPRIWGTIVSLPHWHDGYELLQAGFTQEGNSISGRPFLHREARVLPGAEHQVLVIVLHAKQHPALLPFLMTLSSFPGSAL